MDPGLLWSVLGASSAAARTHGVSPWFHRHPPSTASAADRELFAADYRRTLARNLFFLQAGVRAMSGFSRAGLAVIPLKGVFFAARFFRDPGVRLQSDVDLLVRPAERERAHQTLLGDGWRVAVPREFYRDHYHWVYEKDGALLELHWALRAPGLSTPNLERLWSDAKISRREGYDVAEFSPEDTLLYMAVNKAQQRYARLSDFLDLAAVVDGGVDWALVAENARRDGVAPLLWFGLSSLREMSGTEVPPWVLGRLGRGPSVATARLLRWFRSRKGWIEGVSSGPFSRLQVAALEGTPSKAWMLFKPLLFPSRARVDVVSGGSWFRYYGRLLVS